MGSLGSSPEARGCPLSQGVKEKTRRQSEVKYCTPVRVFLQFVAPDFEDCAVSCGVSVKVQRLQAFQITLDPKTKTSKFCSINKIADMTGVRDTGLEPQLV